jgi:hypothetical protein
MNKRLITVASTVLALSAITACDKKQPPAPGGTPPKNPAPKPTTGHSDEHAGEIKLGSTTIAGFTVAVSIGERVKAGEEAHVDMTITGGTGKPKSVRVWIGTEDGAGSIKSLAEFTDPGYHSHAEAPNPLPAGARLWVSIDDEKDVTHIGGFDLK